MFGLKFPFFNIVKFPLVIRTNSLPLPDTWVSFYSIWKDLIPSRHVKKRFKIIFWEPKIKFLFVKKFNGIVKFVSF
ncbi:hypothetical protein DO021_06700 [Desulfobacter hydrogenophilus]|uniref:Uncharacterized protein n=1 Tax=Desulfobacter hydrogenophilus TaxID=2291 RepID=A0A328FI88_9BACT|nr:hypothetical protein DO021_06700 [Desulfobacter hydrogenophilus]